jgi:hypothetical protein
MPILKAIQDINLPNLLERPEVGEGMDERRWCALQSLPRQEKVLLQRLLAMGIEFYGVMYTALHRSPSGRIRKTQLPLFPGYAFHYGDEETRHRAMTTHCVSKWLRVPDHEQQRLTSDLRQFFTCILNNVPLLPVDRLIKGDPVHIKGGPLRGIIGTFIKYEHECKVQIACDFLQKGALVAIDKCDIEPI